MAPAGDAISEFRRVTMCIMVPLAMLVYMTTSCLGQTQFGRLRPLRFDPPSHPSPAEAPSSPIHVDANAFSAVKISVAPDVPAPQPVSEATAPVELDRPIQLKPIELASLETKSIFDAENSQPVVMFWLNADLEDQLLSQQQLRQLLGRMPARDQTSTLVGDNERSVRLVSFLQEETKPADQEESVEREPEEAADSPVKGFQESIDALNKRHETRKAQIADDKTLDTATIGDLNSQMNLAHDWIIKATTGIADFKEQKEKFDAFETTIKKLEEKRAEELPLKPAAPDPVLLRHSRQRVEAVEELTKLVLSDLSQQTDLDRRDARTKTDELKSKIETLSAEGAEAIETLAEEIQKKTALLQDRRDKLRDLRERIAVRDVRVTELPRVSNKVGNDLADVKDQIEELREIPDDSRKSVQMLVLESKELALEIQEEAIRLEAKRQDQTGQLFPLEVSILTAQIKRLEPELKAFRQALGTLRDAEIQVREKLDKIELNDEVTARFNVLKNLAERNKEFTEERSDLIDKREESGIQLAKVKKQNDEIELGFKNIKAGIEKLGKAASGIRLIEYQRTLVSTGESQMRRMQLYNESQASKLETLQLKELRDQLNNRDDYLANVVAKLDAELAADKEYLSESAEERERTRSRAIEIAGRLVATQEDYVAELIKDYGSYEEAISNLDVQYKDLIDRVQKARKFIEQHALWVRSATPVGLKDIATSQKGMAEFFDGARWQSLSDHFSGGLADRPYDAAVLAIFMGSMFVVQRRLRWSHD